MRTLRIPFVKLHGAKNDFLLTMVEDAPHSNLPEIAVAICCSGAHASRMFMM